VLRFHRASPVVPIHCPADQASKTAQPMRSEGAIDYNILRNHDSESQSRFFRGGAERNTLAGLKTCCVNPKTGVHSRCFSGFGARRQEDGRLKCPCSRLLLCALHETFRTPSLLFGPASATKPYRKGVKSGQKCRGTETGAGANWRKSNCSACSRCGRTEASRDTAPRITKRLTARNQGARARKQLELG